MVLLSLKSTTKCKTKSSPNTKQTFVATSLFNIDDESFMLVICIKYNQLC